MRTRDTFRAAAGAGEASSDQRQRRRDAGPRIARPHERPCSPHAGEIRLPPQQYQAASGTRTSPAAFRPRGRMPSVASAPAPWRPVTAKRSRVRAAVAEGAGRSRVSRTVCLHRPYCAAAASVRTAVVRRLPGGGAHDATRAQPTTQSRDTTRAPRGWPIRSTTSRTTRRPAVPLLRIPTPLPAKSAPADWRRSAGARCRRFRAPVRPPRGDRQRCAPAATSRGGAAAVAGRSVLFQPR